MGLAQGSDEAEVEVVEADIEPVPGSTTLDDNVARSEQTATDAGDLDEAWPFDEDELTGDPNDPAEAARLRRQRLLRRAMENLGGLPRGPAAPQGGVVEAPVSPVLAPDASAGAASLEQQRFATEIERRFVQLQSKPDHFTVLGLSRQAEKDQVKASA